MKKTFSILGLVVVGLTTVCSAAAQTARIAHFSHGGSMETLDEAVDNFGRVEAPYFKADSIRLISDTMALGYGRWHKIDNAEKTLQIRLAARVEKTPERLTKQQLVREYQHYQPEVKLIGFDSTHAVSPVPLLKKPKTKHKKSAFMPTTPAPPRHPGVALAVAAILTLGGLGWLLGERRPAHPQAA